MDRTNLKLVNQDFLDVKIYEPASPLELPEIRKVAISKIINIHSKIGLTANQSNTLKDYLLQAVAEKSINRKNDMIQKASLVLDVSSSLENTYELMCQQCAYYYYLENEQDYPIDSKINEKANLFKRSGGVADFFILNYLKNFKGYSINLASFTVIEMKKRLKEVKKRPQLMNLLKSTQILFLMP